MNIAGKITKGVLFAVGGVVLVLFAVFIYINNDLGSGQFVKRVQQEVVGKLPVVPVKEDDNGAGSKVDQTDVTQTQSDAQLDAVFEKDEVVDNFDDLVE